MKFSTHITETPMLIMHPLSKMHNKDLTSNDKNAGITQTCTVSLDLMECSTKITIMGDAAVRHYFLYLSFSYQLY